VNTAICRSIHTKQSARHNDLRIRGRGSQGSNGLALHIVVAGPGDATIIADIQAAVTAAQHPGPHENVSGIGFIQHDGIQHQIVTISDAGKSLPVHPTIMRLVDPAIQRAQIKMRWVLGIDSQGSRISAIRPEGQPGGRISPKAGESKKQSKKRYLKSKPSGQRIHPVLLYKPTVISISCSAFIALSTKADWEPTQSACCAFTARFLLLLVTTSMVSRGRSRYRALIHSGDTSAVEGGAGRNQGRRYSLAILRSGVDRDAAGVDSLLLDQVFLRVDSALGSNLATVLLGAGSVSDECKLRIRRLLQFEGDIVEAGLAFVVDTDRTTLVTLEVDRAEAADRGCRRRRRRAERDIRCGRC